MLTSGGIQVGWGKRWETLANAINDYYGGGIEGAQYQRVVNMLNSGNYTMEEMDAILKNIPGFNRTYNAAGQLTNVSYTANVNAATSAAGSVAQQVNSNVANTTKTQFSTVQTITKDAQTGKVTISDNVVKYKTGQLAPTTTKSLFGSTVGALAAASVGIKAGKAIDSVLYNLNPDFWDDHNMSALNPETWGSITAGENDAGSQLFNWVFCIDPETNNPEPYIDANAFAYMLAYMGSQGVFDTGDEQASSDVFDIPVLKNNSFYYTNAPLPNASGLVYIPYFISGGSTDQIAVYMGANRHYEHMTCGLKYGDTFPQRAGLYVLFTSTTSTQGALSYTYDNKTVYYMSSSSDGTSYNCTGYGVITNPYSTRTAFTNYAGQLAWIIEYGIHSGGGGVEGIDDQEGATVFDGSGISDWSDISAVLAALLAQYPELWENRVEVSPDGENTMIYLPASFPTGGEGSQPTTDGATQGDTAIDISDTTDELIKTLIDLLQEPQTQGGMESDTNTPTKPIDPNANDTGTGETPAIIPPIGTASALWKIYNPSQAQLDTFGAWLWSSNFVDQLLKLFNDPMQAIIGLHKIYATPPTSGSGAIKVGYLVSDASANYVSAQYTEIDCGSVDMLEDFNNVFDYDPFTKITVFLPFIGFRSLNVSDVMRGKIGIKYTVDVLTGACLAKVSVSRDANTNVLYTFAGNCAVQYPVSSGSYVGIITGLLGIAGGIAGTIASGGALAPMLMGAGASVGAMHTNVEHSGNISSNAGAMGSKKPYIVIERPQTKIPLYGVDIEGKPQNETVILGTCSGHVRVKAAEFNGFSCTTGELTKIKQLLSSGIII